jgi:hypothetical protein
LKEALVMVAKAPRAGEVKTRLHGALGPVGATELYRCFLRDTFAIMEAARDARPTLSLGLCYTPAGEERAFDRLGRDGSLLLAQRGADLGQRLRHCFEDLFAAGYDSVAIMNSDSPTLPSAYLLAAFDHLKGEEMVVLGPTTDGGYYLIGMRRLHPQLFERITWSTARVLAETRERAREAGLEVILLPEWFDVDTPEELARLQREIGRDGHSAKSTRAFLQARARGCEAGGRG